LNARRIWAQNREVHLQSSRARTTKQGRGFPGAAGSPRSGHIARLEGAGHAREPRVSVSRSISRDRRSRRPIRARARDDDPDRFIDRGLARSRRRPQLCGRAGRIYSSSSGKRRSFTEADTLLLTVPNQLGVPYNAHVIERFDPTSLRLGVAANERHISHLKGV